MCRFLSLALFAVLLFLPAFADGAEATPTPPEGVLPVGADGKPLNLDFETGTLKDWTAEGDAFKGQPIKGDTVAKRRGDMKSQHQGEYWIGSYETARRQAAGHAHLRAVQGDASVGVVPRRRRAVAGNLRRTGPQRHQGSLLAHLRHRGGKPAPRRRRSDGRCMGKEIFIRLVDKHSGHWGHINFDDFRFHAEKPNVPPRKAAAPPPDVYKYAGLPPDKAAAAMTVPEGFTVTLFAGEPDVLQPIAMCLDDRGRLWVAEAYSYPDAPARQGGARTASSSSRTPTATASSTSAPSSWKG